MKGKKGKVLSGLKKHKKVFVLLMVVVIVVGAGAIIWKKKSASSNRTMTKTGYETAQITKRDLTSSVSTTGTFKSTKTSSVTGELSNVKVKSLKVKEGDTVKKGDTIAVLDTSDLEDQLEDAKDSLSDTQTKNSSNISSASSQLENEKENQSAQVSQALKNKKSTKEEYESAKKKLTSAKKAYEAAKGTNKESELKKTYEEAQNAVTTTKKSYEQAVTEYDNAKRNSNQSISQQEQSLSNTKTEASSSEKNASKQVTQLQEQIDKATVKAPCAGTVTSISVEEGNTYTGGSIVELQDCNNFVVETEVDEYDISNVKTGMSTVIKSDALGDDELKGTVSSVAQVSTSSSSSSNTAGSSGMTSSSSSSDATYLVKINVNTEDERIKVGMTAKVAIVLEEVKDVLAVPYDAVSENANGDKVIYVLDSSSSNQDSSSDQSQSQTKQSDAMPNNSGDNQETPMMPPSGTNFSDKNGSNSSAINKKEIVVTTGVENDYYIEVSGDGVEEGMKVIIPSDTNGSDQKSSTEKSNSGFGGFGGMGGSSSGGNRGAGMKPGN